MAPGKMSVVKGAQPRTVMYRPAATGVVFEFWMVRSEGNYRWWTLWSRWRFSVCKSCHTQHWEHGWRGRGLHSLAVHHSCTGNTGDSHLEGQSRVWSLVCCLIAYLSERKHLRSGEGTRGKNIWTCCVAVLFCWKHPGTTGWPEEWAGCWAGQGRAGSHQAPGSETQPNIQTWSDHQTTGSQISETLNNEEYSGNTHRPSPGSN